MKVKHYIIILCCALFIACTQQPSFPRKETITHELFPLQGVTAPSALEVKHPFLVVQNDRERDSLFHIYNLNTYQLTSAFGVRGQGPDEFISPFLLPALFSDFVIADMDNRFQTYLFGITQEGTPMLNAIIRPKNEGLLNAAFINDSLYVSTDIFFAPRLSLFTFQDEEPRKIWGDGRSDLLEFWLNPEFGWVFANDSRILLAYSFKNLILFMDTDFNIIKEVRFRHRPPRTITRQNLDVIENTYVAGYVGKRYFYALFVGTPWTEWEDPSFRRGILKVFDLDGNPIIKYHLDGLMPTTFVVDEETFTLYGFRFDGEPEDYLIVYRLIGLQ